MSQSSITSDTPYLQSPPINFFNLSQDSTYQPSPESDAAQVLTELSQSSSEEDNASKEQTAQLSLDIALNEEVTDSYVSKASNAAKCSDVSLDSARKTLSEAKVTDSFPDDRLFGLLPLPVTQIIPAKTKKVKINKKKKKKQVETPEEKLKRKRERNKVLAKESRERKKKKLHSLLEKVDSQALRITNIRNKIDYIQRVLARKREKCRCDYAKQLSFEHRVERMLPKQ